MQSVRGKRPINGKQFASGVDGESCFENLLDCLLPDGWRENENFADTPRRAASVYEELLHRERPKIKVFPSTSTEMVVLKDFVDYSLCPHHLLPVKYTFRVGYVPTGQVIGLSKIPRIIHYLMSKLPLQEDLPDLIVKELIDLLRPMGCGCQVRGQHMCMEMRGVRTEGEFITTKLTGIILMNPASHEEFLAC